MIKTVVEHYKNRDSIEYWQIENEAFLGTFGVCPPLDQEFLKKEFALVRSLDDRQIIITGSGELGFWKKEAKIGDIFEINDQRAKVVAVIDMPSNAFSAPMVFTTYVDAQSYIDNNLDIDIFNDAQPTVTSRQKNPEYYKKHCANRRENLNQHAYNSIESGKIIDTQKWDHWCNKIKSSAKTNNHPYSDDFTNDVMFEMMIQRCFYCGDIATTIDRIDSKIVHTPENCVGSCYGCNKSKGTADPSTFVKKAYYRARGEYYDDDIDIWYVHKTKPSICHYKIRANKTGHFG
jgi:hypothetical protein